MYQGYHTNWQMKINKSEVVGCSLELAQRMRFFWLRYRTGSRKEVMISRKRVRYTAAELMTNRIQ